MVLQRCINLRMDAQYLGGVGWGASNISLRKYQYRYLACLFNVSATPLEFRAQLPDRGLFKGIQLGPPLPLTTQNAFRS